MTRIPFDRQTPGEMLGEYHEEVKHPEYFPNALKLRRKLFSEEVHEYKESFTAYLHRFDRPPDTDQAMRASIAKEMADLVYVIYGTAQLLRIDLDGALAAVHKDNQARAKAGTIREDGKLIKPDGWPELDLKDYIH